MIEENMQILNKLKKKLIYVFGIPIFPDNILKLEYFKPRLN